MPFVKLLNRDINAVAFDAYGTLFDVHAAVSALSGRIGPKAPDVSESWRVKQLEYAWVHTLMGHYIPFWDLTKRALDFALEKHSISDPLLRRELLELYRSIPAFPDARSCLVRLRASGLKVAILTNADRQMISAAVNAAGLSDVLDDVISIEDIRQYKTHPAAYELACKRLETPAARLAFVSSNGWDVAGATEFGLSAIRLRRSAVPLEYPDHTPAALITSLSDLTG